jgi:2-polyprenyl-3-methyl-5-hydroxy-6-metoxy-1,4-benzoquinol methylase
MSEYILPAPTNNIESGRLDHQHEIFLRTLGSLYKAPLDTSKPLKVLDIGCGNGNWAIAFALEHAQAHVTGLDITASPQWANAPSNCSFRQASAEGADSWDSLPGQFDFIHGRMIMVFVRSWPNLFKRCYGKLAPGGWVEIQDLQFPLQCLGESADTAKCKTLQWSDGMVKGMQMAGVAPAGAMQFAYILPRLGFVDVNLEDRQMLFGEWPESEQDKELGRMGLENLRLGSRGWSRVLFTKVLGMSAEEHEELNEGFYREALDGKVKAFVPLKFCCARKPL